MAENKDIGLENGNQAVKNKKVNDLKIEHNTKRVDFDFFSNGIPVISIEGHSANHFFGNGSWKREIRNNFGEEKLQALSEKHGNKPIDFKLAGLHIAKDQMKFFDLNERVTVRVGSGSPKYNGTHKIIAKGPDYILLMKEFLGNAQGMVINENKLQGARKKMDFLTKQISNLTGDGLSENNDTNHPPPLPVNEYDVTTVPEEDNESITTTKNKIDMKTVLKALAWIAGIGLLIYGGYMAYQKWGK